MKITAKGWSREYMTHTIGGLNLDACQWDHKGSRFISKTYGYQTDDGVAIKFGGEIHLQGNFDFTMYVTREDAAQLFAKAFDGRPLSDAIQALAPYFQADAVEDKKAA